jgi:hypothetical protein
MTRKETQRLLPRPGAKQTIKKKSHWPPSLVHSGRVLLGFNACLPPSMAHLRIVRGGKKEKGIVLSSDSSQFGMSGASVRDCSEIRPSDNFRSKLFSLFSDMRSRLQPSGLQLERTAGEGLTSQATYLGFIPFLDNLGPIFSSILL